MFPSGSWKPAPWQTPESHISLTCTPAASSFALASATSGTRNAIVPGGTAVMLAVAVSARAPTADLSIEVTLSPGLRTSPLPATPAGVADRWRNIG